MFDVQSVSFEQAISELLVPCVKMWYPVGLISED